MTLLIAVALYLAQCGLASTPYESFVPYRAVWAHDRLWFLAGGGRLLSLREDEGAPVLEPLNDSVLELTVHERTLHAIATVGSSGRGWSVLRRVDSGFESVAEISIADDGLVGLASSPTGIVLVTTRRLLDIGGGKVQETWLSKELLACTSVATLFVNAKYLYVGIDVGEWGGGLLRVDRATGQVDPIDREDPEDPSCTLLNPDLYSITAIVPLPWDSDALAISSGSFEGDVFLVRGSRVRRFSRLRPAEQSSECPALGMASSASTLWALGLCGIHRIDPGGCATLVPPPPMRNYRGLEASFAIPGLVVIARNDPDRPSWPFGSCPLLVSR
jgi:hypothetical protein